MDSSRDPGPASAYDRGAIVASIGRYYDTLSRMVSIKPTQISYPPENGWGDDLIPFQHWRTLGFNDRVVDFLRHMPYVYSERPIFPSTESILYLNSSYPFTATEEIQYDACDLGFWPFPDDIADMPKGVVPLSARLRGDPFATWWILDTNTGEITAHESTLMRPSEEVPEDEPWRSSRPVPAVEYFNDLREKLMALDLVPVPSGSGGDDWEWEIWWARRDDRTGDRWVTEAQEIYRQCHWPDTQRFKRRKCRKLLVDLQDRLRAENNERRRAMTTPPATSA